ncbi:nucleotidyltransferase domain-containing protein [Agromyces sp. SYSU T00266]|uniref:nucleotidyltransferase domain-containing protein n=1 Tax=Agromyces zhanjiangensis TaxID=3158562 RepID=UPI003399616E
MQPVPLDDLTGTPVVPVAEARAGLSRLLRGFRAQGAEAKPVVIGSHRKPEAVLLPYAALSERSSSAAHRPEPVLDLLHRRKQLIERLARANRIGSVQVFGSVARGDEAPVSDIDLLVDPDPDASLFDLAQFELDLELLLERPVDVVSRRSLDPERDHAVLAEAIDL